MKVWLGGSAARGQLGMLVVRRLWGCANSQFKTNHSFTGFVSEVESFLVGAAYPSLFRQVCGPSRVEAAPPAVPPEFEDLFRCLKDGRVTKRRMCSTRHAPNQSHRVRRKQTNTPACPRQTKLTRHATQLRCIDSARSELLAADGDRLAKPLELWLELYRAAKARGGTAVQPVPLRGTWIGWR